jgi:hypothetical protein
VPWYNPFRPVAALSYQQRKYPYQKWEGIDTVNETITLSIPHGYETIGMQEFMEYTNPAARYYFSSSKNADGLNLNRKVVNLRRLIMPQDYLAYKDFYNNVVRADRQALLLAPRGTVVRTPKPAAKDNRQ